MNNGICGDVDERRAIIVGNDFNTARQAAVPVHLVDFGFNAFDDFVGMERPIHHDDAGDDIVLIIAARFAKPRDIADLDFRDVLHQNRHAIGLAEDNVFEVGSLVALWQIIISAIVDQSDAANVDGLLSDIDRPPADVDIGVIDGADQLRDHDVVGVELVAIDVDLEFLRRPAPRIDLDDARHPQQTANYDPLLNRAEVGQTEMWWTNDLIAEDFADKARSLDVR